MFSSQQQRMRTALAEVAAFNKKFSLGEAVWLVKDNGEKVPCHLRDYALVSDAGIAVAWVTAYRGCWRVDRIEKRSEGE